MKKIFIFVFAVIFTLTAFAVPAWAAYNSEVTVDADIAYLVSLDRDNTIIYDKNSNQRFTPAAVAKIITGIVTIENCANLDQKLTLKKEAVTAAAGTGSAMAGLYPGEEISVRDLLYCALVYNAADAACVLADFIGGDIPTFVGMMNDLAARLGCVNTHFTNPVGYDEEGQYTTARELAALYYYCVSNQTFDEIISTDYYEVEPTNEYWGTRYLRTTNGLMNSGIPDYYFRYVKSGKSGVTDDNRCNSVSVASKDGYNYLCVIMNAPIADYDEDGADENMAYVSARQLYEWTFNNIRLRVVANTATYVTEVKVRLSNEYDYVSLVPAQEVSALVPSGVGAESVLLEPIQEQTPESVKAPIKKGDVIGRAAIKYAGETIAEVDLAAAFDVNSSFIKFVGDLLLSVLRSTVFRIIFLLALAAGVIFLLLTVRNNRQYGRKNTTRRTGGSRKPADTGKKQSTTKRQSTKKKQSTTKKNR